MGAPLYGTAVLGSGRPRAYAYRGVCDSVVVSGERAERDALHVGVTLSHYHTWPEPASRTALGCDTLSRRLSQGGTPLYRVTYA